MSSLLERSCSQSPESSTQLSPEEVSTLMKELDAPWELGQDGQLEREFLFPSFESGLGFINQVAGVAQREDHHPQLVIDRRSVKVQLFTHSVNGLSQNDFILAAKITDAVSQLATALMVDVAALKSGEADASSMKKLADAELSAFLETHAGWSLDGEGRLTRKFDCKSYTEVLSLGNRIASLAKQSRHPPKLSLGINSIQLQLFSFAVDGISALDLELAEAIERDAKEQ